MQTFFQIISIVIKTKLFIKETIQKLGLFDRCLLHLITDLIKSTENGARQHKPLNGSFLI